MQAIDSTSAELLIQQGIAAVQSGDQARARALLCEALEETPRNQQAWLWLSGAVSDDGERRYCLEQVLAIDPSHTAARRGLELLPATTIPLSPLPIVSPVEVAPQPPAATSSSNIAVQEILAPPVTARPGEAASLLDILDQPDDLPHSAAPATRLGFAASLSHANLAPLSSSALSAPPATTPAPVPAAAPAQDPQRQAIVDLVIREYTQHRSRDEIIRMLSQEHGIAWSDAQELLNEVETKHRRRIAARQSPLFILLGIVTILGGCYLAGRSGIGLYVTYIRATEYAIVNPQAVVLMIGQLGTGIAMVLGALIGLGQTIKSLLK